MTMFTRRCCRQLITWRSEFASGFKILLMLVLLSSFFISNRADAQCNSFGIDFKQGANRDNFQNYVTGEIHWIGSILQNSNSRYIEGMSTLQRLVFNNLASCNGNHVLRMKMESRKADQHAYDFITSWDNAFKAAEAIAPGFGLMPTSRSDPRLHECGPDIGACSETACNLVTNNGTSGGTHRDLPVIFDANPTLGTGAGETNLSIEGPPADQNTTRQVIAAYECRYSDHIVVGTEDYGRSVRVYVDNGTFSGTVGDANNRVVFVGYGDANPNDGGDTYIYYDIKWQSPSPDVVIEFGAHIAVGVDGLAASNPGGCNVNTLGVGYLIAHGASSISGGPYHVIVEDFQDAPGNTPKCEGNLGNLDNQLQGSEILLIPECNLTGPGTACTGQTGLQYSASIINTDNSTFAWSIINNTSPTPATITSGNETTTGPITVTAGSPGSFTVRLIVLNGGTTTNNTDDDIADTCYVTTIVGAGPTIACPTSTTVAACQTQTQVDAAYAAWLAQVTATGGTPTNNGGSAPAACGGSKTVTFTVSNSCGTQSCTSTFTVTNAPAVVLTCALNTTIASCLTQTQVDALYASWLATATASGGCSLGPVTNNGGTAPNACGGSKTVTFTVTSSCESPKTCSATFQVTNAPAVVLTCAQNTTVGSCLTQGQVNTAYAAWLATATASGGCSRGPVTNNGGDAPSACGGSKTVTFTVTSACESPKTCSATFTVTNAPAVVLTCAVSTTVAAGQTQGAVDAEYAAWLATATASGGCNRGPVTNDGGSAPNACGGSKTVTFSVTSSCEGVKTCSATFTVTAQTPVSLTCPTSTTIAACTSQTSIDAQFAAWLASVVSSGGTLTRNPVTPVAPNACAGGTTVVTWTVTNSCFNQTCSASFTVNAAPAVVLTCATSTTVASCQTQSQVDAEYGTWLASATASGGCNRGSVTNNGGSAPSACGGSKTVTFSVTSSCEGVKTCSATFTVSNAPAVVLTCAQNTTVGSCQTQTQIDALYATWLATATASGGCGLGPVTNNGGSAPGACGGSKTVTFTVTSSCESPKTCSATFTVTNAPAVVLTCAENTTISANQSQTDVDAAFAAWLATASASGGCNTSLSNDNTGAPDACGGSKTVTFTATSSCEGAKTCSATFTVPEGCVNVLCTYTQGYYGNLTGIACNGAPADPGPNQFTTTQLIFNSLTAWGGTLTIGCTGHSVVITTSSADITCLINVLPGGGAPKALPAGNTSICNLSSVGLLKNGKINNALLAQTIALGLNMGINSNLSTFGLQANKYLVTADVTECGSTTIKDCQFSCVAVPDGLGGFTYQWSVTYTPYHVGCKISQALYDALTTKDVAGLYALANSALCGNALPTGVSYSDIAIAEDCINNAFDGCRSATPGWVSGDVAPDPKSFCNLPSTSTPCPAVTAARPTSESFASTDNLKVTAYPNPFTSTVRFTIQSNISGQASLEVYNAVGQRVGIAYKGYLQANRGQVVDYKAPRIGSNLIYILRVGSKQATGKLLRLE